MPRPFLVAVLAAALALPATAAELSVGAATVLASAFTELGRVYNTRHPGDDINLQFAPSGILLQQQQNGVGFDLLALNDEGAMNEAESAGQIRPNTRQRFASNRLVLVVPGKSPLPIRGVLDLSRSNIKRVALENSATTPAGRFSRLALMQAGIWKTVEAKAEWGQNSQECLELVARGEVDAAFALASEALRRGDEVKTVAEIPTPEPMSYSLATTAHSRQQRLASRFAEFVHSPEGQAILERYGFTPAVPPASTQAQHEAHLYSGGKGNGKPGR
jgi:molybdate transport system substrate-binding protein